MRRSEQATAVLARKLGQRPAEVGRRGGVLQRRAAARVRGVRGERGRRRLRMGQAAFASPVPMPDDGCYDVATGSIIGGRMDGIVPAAGQVSIYTDATGYQRAEIDVAGDNRADLPVCDTGGGGGHPGGGNGGNGNGSGLDGFCSPMDCETYGAPPVIIGPDGCDIGYNGCGDTIGINVTIPGSTTQDVNVPAAIEFSPRYFIYTGIAATFLISRIFVANGPNSNFGVGYSADTYALTSFTSKRVSWPTFYNSPPLSITVQNLSVGAQVFRGLLIGVASHQ